MYISLCLARLNQSPPVSSSSLKQLRVKASESLYTGNPIWRGLTVLHTDDNPLRRDKWSYILLAEELRRFSAEPALDARELFRRMVFNALITNTDDHPRNHAFIAKEGWRLSPAYDLTPFPMYSTERRDLAMSCGAYGRFANSKNLISECRRFMIEPGEAKDIIEDMADIVSKQWRKTVKEAGLSEQDSNAIESAFLYPGFFTE